MSPRPLRVPVGAGEVHLLATVQGLDEEGPRVTQALDALRPAVVALSVSEEELSGLQEWDGERAEEVDDAEYDPGFAAALLEYGPISLPPPDLLAAVTWAKETGARLEAVDLPQHEYDTAFARYVGTWEFIFYGRRVRKLGKRPPQAPTAHEFVVAWDRGLRASKGVARVEAIRERHMAVRLAALAEGGARVVAVVSPARVEGILQSLRAPPARANAPPS